MKKRILEQLHDIFDIKRNAPLFFRYLVETEAFIHSLAFRQIKSSFLKNKTNFIERANSDYDISYPVSIPLSHEPVEFNDSLTELLFKRKSVRKFKKQLLTFEDLSFFLLMSAGLKNARDKKSKRFYPSGGSLYSTRIYVDIRNVSGIESGVYLFNPFRETLDLINDDVDFKMRMELQNNVEEESTISNSNAHILISTKPQVATKKYGDLALRLILIEMGHIVQNMILVSNGIGLTGFPTCTLNLKVSEKMLRTKIEGEFLLYSLVLGYGE